MAVKNANAEAIKGLSVRVKNLEAEMGRQKRKMHGIEHTTRFVLEGFSEVEKLFTVATDTREWTALKKAMGAAIGKDVRAALTEQLTPVGVPGFMEVDDEPPNEGESQEQADARNAEAREMGQQNHRVALAEHAATAATQRVLELAVQELEGALLGNLGATARLIEGPGGRWGDEGWTRKKGNFVLLLPVGLTGFRVMHTVQANLEEALRKSGSGVLMYRDKTPEEREEKARKGALKGKGKGQDGGQGQGAKGKGKDKGNKGAAEAGVEDNGKGNGKGNGNIKGKGKAKGKGKPKGKPKGQ